ncbi:hypothetical protein ACHAQA_006472 [Verticillium albo-atrum]
MKLSCTTALYLGVLLGSLTVSAQSEDSTAVISSLLDTTTTVVEPSTTVGDGSLPSTTGDDTPDPVVTPPEAEPEVSEPGTPVVSTEPSVVDSTVLEPSASGFSSDSIDGASASTTSGASSSLDASGSISPSASASASADEDSEITAVDINEGEESSRATPADVTTPEEHETELVENLPEVAMSEEDAKDVAVLETVMFDYFVKNDPAPGDVGKLTIPENVTECEVALDKRSLWGGSSDTSQDLEARSLRGGWDQCRYVWSLEFDVYVHYIKESYGAERPNLLSERIDGSLAFLNSVYGPLGITFNLKDKQFWRPPQTGDNSDWTLVNKKEDRLQRWQRQTRTGSKMALNVWLVNALNGADRTKSLAGYATSPSNLKVEDKAALDGVVMRESRMQTGYAPTLIHEVGHWLGLQHTFGSKVDNEADDCKSDDGLIDSTQTRGAPNVIFKCSQIPCFGSAAEEIYNFMSYSNCRGKVREQGLTTDQKSAIFARTMKFRRTNSRGECVAQDPDPNALRKRSSMQDLLDGKCPDIEAEVARIVNEKTGSASGVMIRSVWAWGLAAVASFMVIAM